MCLLEQFISKCYTRAQFRALEEVPLPATVRWSGIPISLITFPQFLVIHKVEGFSIIKEAEIDKFFLEFLCFL